MESAKHNIDKILLLIALALMTLGIVMVYSASHVAAAEQARNSTYYLQQQFLRALIGFGVLVVAAKYDYHKYRGKTMLLVLSAFVLLVIVLGLSKVKGASRWLLVGGFGIQPSELAKLAMIFYLAAYLDGKGQRIRDFQNGVLPPLIMASVFALMIVLQPNFSTATVLMLMVVIILFVGGMQMKHLGALALSTIPLLILVVMTSPYRRARLMTFFDPVADTQGSGYQIRQSLISFANGGLTGMGVGQGKQKFLFLPEPFTDFIYSIIGEELGFIGAVLVLGLFITFLFRAIKIARTSPDMYGFYLAIGITVSIVLYAIINAGVTVGLLPTTGLPMPFISYGGSSLIFTCFGVGVLLNISSQTVSKNEAMKPTSGQRVNMGFTDNFSVDESSTPEPQSDGQAQAQPPKKTVKTPSMVGMDFS